MNILFVFGLFLAYVNSVEYFYSDSKFVEEVKTVDQFKRLYNSEHTVVIEFYADWCGHCRQFTDEYEKTAKHLNNIMYFAAVNCGDQEAAIKAGNPETKARQMICSNFKVESLPTVLILKPNDLEEAEIEKGKKVMVKKPTKWNEDKRTAATFTKWCLKNTEQSIISVIKTENELEAFVTVFGSADKTKMIVFGEKETPSNYLVFIAQTVRPDFPHFKKHAFIGYSNNKQLSESLQIQSFPSIVLFNNNNKTVIDGYYGEMTPLSMQDWIFGHSGAVSGPTASATASSPKKPQKRELGLTKMSHPDEWEIICPITPRGLCFMTFINPANEDYASHIEVLKRIYPKYAHIAFSVVDRERFPQFSSKFNIIDVDPQVVLFQRGTLRTKNFFGAFEESQLEEFIHVSLTGKRVYTLESQPVPDQTQESKADL